MAPAKVTVVQRETAEVIRVGPLTIRIIEDGSNTDNRIGAISLTIPPRTPGPPQHWHRMHDETFLITKGRVRFTSGSHDHDTAAGDYVVVPPGAVHAFSNPFDDEAEFYNSFTPAYYVDYLRLLSRRFREKGAVLSDQEQRDVMAQFATFLPEEDGKA